MLKDGWLQLSDLYLHTGATSSTVSALERKGLVSSFQKLAALSSGSSGSSILSSHPPSSERAAAMQKRLDTKAK